MAWKKAQTKTGEHLHKKGRIKSGMGAAFRIVGAASKIAGIVSIATGDALLGGVVMANGAVASAKGYKMSDEGRAMKARARAIDDLIQRAKGTDLRSRLNQNNKRAETRPALEHKPAEQYNRLAGATQSKGEHSVSYPAWPVRGDDDSRQGPKERRVNGLIVDATHAVSRVAVHRYHLKKAAEGDPASRVLLGTVRRKGKDKQSSLGGGPVTVKAHQRRTAHGFVTVRQFTRNA